jgi:hypothetical protein
MISTDWMRLEYGVRLFIIKRRANTYCRNKTAPQGGEQFEGSVMNG